MGVSLGFRFCGDDILLERAGECAAVDQDILSGDVAGLRRAQKRTRRAELVGRADALGRHRFDALGETCIVADVALLHRRLDVGAEAVGVENSRQDEIDGDVGGGDRAGDPGQERGQAGARAGGQIEAGDRHFHRARGDVDDAAEFSRHHWVDGLLDQLDATIMLPMTPSSIFWRSSSRKSRNGGPALLLTRMSGSGQAANSAFWPSAEATSAATGMTLAPVALRSSSAVAFRRSLSRPLITTSQPASASRCAQARPSPRLDAHTIALRPAIPRSMPSSLPSSLLTPPRHGGVPPAAVLVTAPL